jgi:hypothetical protein
MYLLYLDESGSVSNKDEKYFVVGGVCVPERSIKWLTDQIDNLATGIYPDDPSSVEFHASVIFSGRVPPWNTMNKKKRIETIQAVLNLLRDAGSDTVAFACAINKADFAAHDILKMAFEDICSRFDMYLNRLYHKDTSYSHKGMIIFDKNAYWNNLERLSLEFRKQGTKWRDLRNIREVPFFVDSSSSRIIQMADHIAYSVFRRYNAEDLTYFNCIESRFDSDGGTIHGLCHRQTSNPSCSCPACLTRRSNAR